MTVMTEYKPGRKKIAGFVKVALGAGFANVEQPKLSELSLDVSCAINGITPDVDVKMKSDQLLCEADAVETLDTRTDKLGDLTFRGSGSTDEAAFLALVQKDKLVGMFMRPYASSATALATTDKGDAWNFRVAALKRGTISVGEDWTYVVIPYEVEASELNVALS